MSLLLPKFQEFSPFFRFADELERASRLHQNGSSRSFAPRFDVQETQESYELHGELPGVEQSNVNIEWTDDHTLTISGQTEKRYEATNVKDTLEVEEASTPEPQYKKPTVEDEEFENVSKGDSAETKPAEKTVAQAQPNQPRYWITERSFGSFNRTFQFPSRVDHDSVKASMKNGILSVVVPKAKAREPRKITINWVIQTHIDLQILHFHESTGMAWHSSEFAVVWS